MIIEVVHSTLMIEIKKSLYSFSLNYMVMHNKLCEWGEAIYGGSKYRVIQWKWITFYFQFFSVQSQPFLPTFLPKDVPWNSLQEYIRTFGLKCQYEIQLDSVIFDHFLQFTVFFAKLQNFLFLYGWIQHWLLYRTV